MHPELVFEKFELQKICIDAYMFGSIHTDAKADFNESLCSMDMHYEVCHDGYAQGKFTNQIVNVQTV